MRFALLGPLQVTADDGEPIGISQRRLRQLVMLLALDAGSPVPARSLREMMWGDDEGSHSSLSTTIHSARALLGPDRIVHDRELGYRLTFDAACDSRDLDDFHDLVREGRAAADRGEPEDAEKAFESALDLWRDPPQGDLSEYAAGWIEALLEMRAVARDGWFDARLAQGHHEDLIGLLRKACVDEPLNERMWARLVLALYRSGRKADALAAYQRVARLLSEEVGIGPDSALRSLHQQILTEDPVLELSRPVRAGTGVIAPAQLPPGVPDFTGRVSECDEIIGHLTAGARSPGVPIISIRGLPGIGKTCLANHVAHRLRDDGVFPDGQLYLDMAASAGASPNRTAGEVLGEVLRALGVTHKQIPESDSARAALYRSRLAGRRVLVVVDGAADADQVVPFLPGTSGCAVIVTSRDLLSLPGARMLALGSLSETEANELLAQIITPARRDAAPGPARDLVAASGLHPLALRIIGARLAAHPRWPLIHLVARLATARLAELASGDVAVRSSLLMSYQVLSAEARQALRMISLLGPRDFAPWSVAMMMANTGGGEAVVRQLADASLLIDMGVDAAGQDRYRLHDLVREFAQSLLEPDEGEYALQLLTLGVMELVDLADSHIPRPPHVGTPARQEGEIFRDSPARSVINDDASRWLAMERANILAIATASCGDGRYQIAYGVAMRMWPWLVTCGYLEDAEGLWMLVTETARKAGNTVIALQAEFWAAATIGVERGYPRKALPMADRCVAGFESRGDRYSLARALSLRSYCEQAAGDFEAARRDARRGLEVAQHVGNRPAEYSCWLVLALTLGSVGHHDDAARCCANAIAIARDLGERAYECMAIDAQIRVLDQAGGTDLVPALCEDGLRIAAEYGLPRHIASFSSRLGDFYATHGLHGEAIAAYGQAVTAYEASPGQVRDLMLLACRGNLARSLQAAGRPIEAGAHRERGRAEALMLGVDPGPYGLTAELEGPAVS